MTHTDRYGNTREDLLNHLSKMEGMNIPWYQPGKRQQIVEDWPAEYRTARMRRVKPYLDQRTKRSIPSATGNDPEDLRALEASGIFGIF